MNPTYEQLSARVKELVQGVTDLRLMVWGTEQPQGGPNRHVSNRLPEARELTARLLKDDEFLQKTVITHNGQQYYATGKVGNRFVDGMMGREFRTDDDSRCWLYRDLSIKDD